MNIELTQFGIAVYWIILGIILVTAFVKLSDLLFFKHIDLQEAIQKKNPAAVLFFGMMMVGMTFIVGATLATPDQGPGFLLADTIATFAWVILVALGQIILFVIMDKFFVPEVELEKEIKEGNLAAALFSGILFIAISIIGASVIVG